MPRRQKTGTLTKSKMTAKTAAAANVPTTSEAGKGVMAIPPMANVDAIRRSAMDENTTQKLG
jgi:magnesium-transporting ATPase (P-type)